MGQLGRTKDGFYPDLTIGEAIDLIRQLAEVGGHISQTGVAKIVGIDPRGAGLSTRVRDLKAYGLVEGNGELQVTPLAEQIVSGNTDKIWEAFTNIPLYAKMHERLKGKEPPDKVVLQTILYDITKADSDSISRRVARLRNNYVDALQYFPGGKQAGAQALDSRLAGRTNGQQVQQLGVTIPKDYAVLVTDSFMVGARKDLDSLEQLEDGIKSWVTMWKKQLGAKSKARSEPEKKPLTLEEHLEDSG